MACEPQCGFIPLLTNPDENERKLWTFFIRSQQCGFDLENPCHPLPLLNNPNDCASAILNYLKMIRRCKIQGGCSALVPLIPGVDCSPNLKNIAININLAVGAGTGAGGGAGGIVFFVPPPCPTDDFERADSLSVADITHPWNERETGDGAFLETFRILGFGGLFGGFCLGSATAVTGFKRAGFMTFGGIGGGPINWQTDQELSFPGGVTDVTFSSPSGGGRALIGMGLRFSGTITNFTGYALCGTRNIFAPFGGNGMYKFQNVNLTSLTGAGVTFLGSVSPKSISDTLKMTINGSTITITHGDFSTTVFVDTAIIAGGDGPGMVSGADFPAGFGSLETLRWRNVCVADFTTP